MRIWISPILLLFLATACAQMAPTNGEPSLECGAQDYQYLKWQKAEVLNAIDLPTPHRIIMPDSAVTMDYRPERLNFSIGETGRIEVIRCG